MPSERFYKLDDDKQQRIMDASIDEFLKSGYTDASINKIIKEADISRGSFYTYFEDKSELFTHIFNKMKMRARDKILKCLDECRGDVFETSRRLVQNGLKLRPSSPDKMSRLFLRLLSNKDIMEHIVSVSPGPGDPILDEMVDEMYAMLDDLKDYIGREDFTALVDMLVTISIKALTMARGENGEHWISILYKQYDIIEAGIRGGAIR